MKFWIHTVYLWCRAPQNEVTHKPLRFYYICAYRIGMSLIFYDCTVFYNCNGT